MELVEGEDQECFKYLLGYTLCYVVSIVCDIFALIPTEIVIYFCKFIIESNILIFVFEDLERQSPLVITDHMVSKKFDSRLTSICP